MTTPTERVLELLSLLQSGRDWPPAELAARVGTSPRTLRRDLDRLRDLGYPVESTRGPGGAYRLVAGRALPPLMFTDDEAVAAAVALRTASDESAESALRKLEQALPVRLRYRMESIAAATTAGRASAPSPKVVAAVATAARSRQHIRFAYTSRTGTRSTRRVEPYGQVLLGRRWYLRGWDQDRHAWRTFRLDRVTAVSTPGTTFTPRPEPPRDPSPFTSPHPAATIDFDAPAEVVAERLRAEAGSLAATSATTCRYITPTDEWRWLAITLAAVGVPYRVHGPPELIAETRHLATRIGNAAGSPADIK